MTVSAHGTAGGRSSPQLNVSSVTTAFSMPGALSRRSMERSARAEFTRPEQRVRPPQLAGEPPGVRVEQKLVLVEAVTVLRLIGAAGAKTVDQTGLGVGQVAMPDLVRAHGQLDTINIAVGGRDQ